MWAGSAYAVVVVDGLVVAGAGLLVGLDEVLDLLDLLVEGGARLEEGRPGLAGRGRRVRRELGEQVVAEAALAGEQLVEELWSVCERCVRGVWEVSGR